MPIQSWLILAQDLFSAAQLRMAHLYPPAKDLRMIVSQIGCYGRLTRGQYASESTPIWWHPEWRDIIVRGGSPYKSPTYNHSQFADGRSSIDRIVDMGFDGVYLDNVSRATSSGDKWTALQAYNKANPGLVFRTLNELHY